MMSDRLTSVVIPARDAQKTIAQTLESLLAQTDPGWEALVVDDGSVDATSAIIADYAARDSRFIALKSSAKGVSTARNVGVSQASGERILFLDSDDWIDRNFLAKMNAALNANPSAVAAYCNYCRVIPDGGEAPGRSDPRIKINPFETFARTCATAIHSVLVKRSAVIRVGGFDANLRTCEEWDLWQRIARAGGDWIHVNERLSFYRASDDSLSQDVHQILADARIVIARGFSSDARIDQPVPEHQAGASTAYGSAPTAYAYFALWCAGFDCGRGKGADISQEALLDIPHTEASADLIASTLLDSITVGARTTPDRLAERWHHYGKGVTGLITAIGQAWNAPTAARKIQYRFERMVLDYDDLSAPRALSLTLGLRVDLRRLRTLRPSNNIDRLYVYLCDGPDILTLLDIGVLGEVDSDFWMRLITEHLRHLRIEEKVVGRLARKKIKRFKLTTRIPSFLRSNRNTHCNRLHVLQTMMSRQATSLAGPGSTASNNRRSRKAEGSCDIAREAFWESERRSHVPVLMYHRIASDGPNDLARYRLSPDAFREQMLWLRRHGYHTINSEQLAWFIANNHPFVGRPVLITFDDGYDDFARHAWPVLQANDFSAEVFIVTDLVGKCPEWDAAFGNPAPLMDADKIVALASEGVFFGSHLASHSRSDELATWNLAEELTRSHEQLKKWLRQSVTSFAAPFGCTDQRLRSLAAECGFKTGFSTVSGAASLQADPLNLPRIEVRGDCKLNDFVSCMEAYL
jgi:peptidoglycan/xylan/chitin deacetylase (PgdA/CDA1 family)